MKALAPSGAWAWPWAKFAGSPEALKYNRRDLPFIDVMLAHVPGRQAVVQAGGNLGLFPKRLAALFETVYTFEPAADLFRMLQKNAPEPNIVKFQAALGDERQLVGTSRQRRDGKPNNHEGITHIAGPGVIPTLRIDDLGLPVCDWILLDLEGWELFALRGAEDTLARCRPTLTVEINKSIGFVGFAEDDVRAHLQDRDYVFVARYHSDELWVPRERGPADGA